MSALIHSSANDLIPSCLTSQAICMCQQMNLLDLNDYSSVRLSPTLQITLADAFPITDISYKWNDGPNSVQISADVSLPQFTVFGHRQKNIEVSLASGNMSPYFWLTSHSWPSSICDYILFSWIWKFMHVVHIPWQFWQIFQQPENNLADIGTKKSKSNKI